jgi:hypothetical protein
MFDLTNASNAIEGNTLTLSENGGGDRTWYYVWRKAFARSHRGGRPLQRHTTDARIGGSSHADRRTGVRELHRRILARSQPEIGGVYSTVPPRIAGSPKVDLVLGVKLTPLSK